MLQKFNLHPPDRHTILTERAKIEIESLPIRIFGTAENSIVDGAGLRYVLFVQGCPRDCPGCHNPKSHDINGGEECKTDELWRDIRDTRRIDGVTFSGGEPFLWGHELALIGKAARKSKLDVWTYTGYTLEELLEKAKAEPGTHELLTVTNILVDSPFILEKRDLTSPYRGSTNQRIWNVTCYPNSKNATLLAGG